MSEKTYILDSCCENIPKEDLNNNWMEYRERLSELRKQGMKGFWGGAMFVLIVIGLSIYENSFDLAEFLMVLPVIFAGGLIFISYPFGKGLLERAIGEWSIVGSPYFAVMFFVIKLAAGLALGVFTYPIVVLYNLIQSQKSKRKIRRTWLIIAAMIICYIVLSSIIVG